MVFLNVVSKVVCSAKLLTSHTWVVVRVSVSLLHASWCLKIFHCTPIVLYCFVLLAWPPEYLNNRCTANYRTPNDTLEACERATKTSVYGKDQLYVSTWKPVTVWHRLHEMGNVGSRPIHVEGKVLQSSETVRAAAAAAAKSCGATNRRLAARASSGFLASSLLITPIIAHSS